MNRERYIEDGAVCLAAVIPADMPDRYRAFCDPAVQSAYNTAFTDTYEEFAAWAMPQRWQASILRAQDGVCVGMLMLSPPQAPPDLAIIIYPEYRHAGLGTAAFSLATRYCFETLCLPELYAGCYPDNTASLAMLARCGFVPHPEGTCEEVHYLTGEPRTQLDFVLRRPGGDG